jgi:N-acetylmuramoyl-L-alanine amidase
LTRGISDILFAVKKHLSFLTFFLIPAFAWTFSVRNSARASLPNPSSSQAQAQQSASPPAQQPPQTPTPQMTQAPPAAQSAAPARDNAGPVVVLDPAHGGTDPGARGENDIAEKDVVLAFAREAKGELESQGYRVVLTRNDDSDPSFDERAATANAYRDAVFISIHVASTGTVGTARAYYYQFWSAFASKSQAPAAANSAVTDLVPWEEAQRPFVDKSLRFAEILQAELTTRFSGSPTNATGIAIRVLRSIEAPAVAIEISSTAVSDPSSLSAMAAPLTASIVHAIQAFRPPGTLVTP